MKVPVKVNHQITLYMFWMSYEAKKVMKKEMLLKPQQCKVCISSCYHIHPILCGIHSGLYVR